MRGSWDRDKWGSSPPPITTRLLPKLTKLELDYLTGRDFTSELIAYASLRMEGKTPGGWTAEDLASHGYEATLKYPDADFKSARWWSIAQAAIRNKLEDLRKADGVRDRRTDVEEGLREDAEWSWTPTWFTDETREWMSSVLTPREVQAVVLTVGEDLSSSEASAVMGIRSDSVRELKASAFKKIFNTPQNR